MIQAVEKAEGNILKAVRCSIPTCKDREEALEITCRSAAHAMSDYLRARSPEGYVAFWANRWAPVGVANDPTGLNKNWPRNVLKLWLGEQAHSKSDTGPDIPGGGAAA